MKKIIALACMITCIFGFTACESEPSYTEAELQKIDQAENIVKSTYVPMLLNYSQEEMKASFESYTSEELEYIFEESANLIVDGYAFVSALSSFESTKEVIGEVVSIGEAESKIDGDTIVIEVTVTGANKDAKAEVIVSNDMFYKLESASLNEEATMGDLMTKAALNTLIGMGTVFIVLILISVIIALFGFIPKIQAKMANRGKEEETKIESIDNTIAQIVEKEDVTDDFELVAVIAAAIAASEGQASTDGFVVRSIRKVNRRK